MSNAYDRMVQDFRDVAALPVTRSRALFVANTACAYLILTEGLPASHRRALAGAMRAGSAVEAGGGPAYVARFQEELLGLIQVLSR